MAVEKSTWDLYFEIYNFETWVSCTIQFLHPPLPDLSLLYPSPLSSLPDLSLSISFTVPRPEIAKMGQVEGERRLVMCESLWILPFWTRICRHIRRYIPTHVKGGGKIVQLGRVELTRWVRVGLSSVRCCVVGFKVLMADLTRWVGPSRVMRWVKS